MLIASQKSVNNSLQKILPQSGFELGTFSGAGILKVFYFNFLIK